MRALLCAALLAATPALALLGYPPPPPRAVYDGAGALSQSEKAKLEEKLAAIERQSGAEVAVAIFHSLEGESLEDYTNRLFEKWKPGQKGQDNGVLITAFMQDRKVRIEVGYGLEDKLTDAHSSQIIRERIVPAFRAGNVFAGLASAVDAISLGATGQLPEPSAAPVTRMRRQPESGVGMGCLIMGVLMLIFIGNLLRPRSVWHRRRRWGGTGNLRWLWLFLDAAASSQRSHRRSGWGGGGGFGGGGFGGGGGGFGGGSSGGGGASGSW